VPNNFKLCITYFSRGGRRKFCMGRLSLPWLWAWWACRSHTKHRGRLIRLQEFSHWVFLFHFSATVLCTRLLVIYSFMLLQALHVETKIKNLNLPVTLRVQKVWERRSHPTTPLLTGLMLTSSHLYHSLQLV